MKAITWKVSACALAAISLAAPRAHAEADASSRAMAVQLFDEAEALFAKQQLAAACPKYAESYKLDPQLGALIYLAECYEKNKQLASAWGSYREAVELAQKRGDPRGVHAQERARALEPRLDHLLIQVPGAARVPGLEVSRDGLPINEALWGSAIAIDPGTHHLEAHAAGYKPWQADVDVLGETQTQTVSIPALEAEPVSVNTSAAPAAASTASPGGSQRIAAIALGGVGIVGLGVGGFFGLSAQSSNSDSKDYCNESNYCTLHGRDLRDSAKSKALVATVATGVGVAALATAAVLWFTAPSSEAPANAARPTRKSWALAPKSDAWGLEMSGAF